MDDRAAYPKIIAAITGGLGPTSARFLQHREDVMRAFSTYLFAEIPEWSTRRKYMNSITNGFDMDSGIDAWKNRKDMGAAPRGRTLKNKRMTLPCGEEFSLEEYRMEQVKGTRWIAARSAGMIAFMERMPAQKGAKTPRRMDCTVKSYILQEAEAASREAKLEWCMRMGVRVMSLQHDGVLCAPHDKYTWADMATEMSMACSGACRMAVEVEAKVVRDSGRAAEWAAFVAALDCVD